MSEQDIPRYRRALAVAINEGTDPGKALADLLYANVPLHSKFLAVDFCDLLTHNAQSAQSLKKLIQAMSILEKYARHLLKPPEQRSNMWRHIKYSNNIFRERVNAIQGGSDVMHLMGYTEKRQDGVAFPDGVEPIPDRILNLLVDLVEGRKELEIFLEGNHPKPENIQQYLTPQLILSLQSDNIVTTVSQQGMQNTVPGSEFVQNQPTPGIPSTSIQAGSNLMHQSYSQSPSHDNLGTRQKTTGQNFTQSSQYAEPNLLSRSEVTYPNNSQVPQITYNYPKDTYMQNTQSEQSVQGQMATIDLQSHHPSANVQGHHPDANGQDPSANVQGHHPNANVQGHHPSANAQGQGHQHHAQANFQGQGNILGRNVPDHRQFTDNYRQRQGDINVSNFPGQGQSANSYIQGDSLQSSQQYQQMQHRQGGNKNDEVLSETEIENKIPSIVCDICGDNDAVVICKVCDNKQLCKDCDIKWHNHPKRQNHKLEYIHPTVNNDKTTSSIVKQSETFDPRLQGAPESMYTIKPGPVGQFQQGYSLQGHEPSRVNQVGYNIQGQVPLRQTQAGYNMQGQEPSRQAQGGYSLQRQQMSPNLNDQYPQNMDNRQAQYSTKPSQYNTMNKSIDQSSPASSEHVNPHAQGSFMYPQPSMMGHIPGTMHYPVSSGMYQHGQLQYTMPPHMVQGQVPQYPLGYLPNVFMPQQQPQQQQMSMQGYLTPVASGVPDMARQENSRSATFPRSSSTNSMSAAPVVVQNVRNSISSPKVSESSDTSNVSMSNVSPASSGSRLLPKIKAISNLEKQHAKLEINLMTLRDDLKEWEEKINEIILQDSNFFQDEEYKRLNRKKRKHLQEVAELQKYQVELEQIMKERENKEIERKDNEVELLKQRFNQIKTGSNNSQPANSEPPLAPAVMEHKVPATTASNPVSSGLVPAGPVTTTYRVNQAQKNLQSSGEPKYDNCPPLHLNSFGDDLPEDIKKMLVLDVNPHAPTHQVADEIMLPNQVATDPNVIVPPHISNQPKIVQYENLVGFKKGYSEPNLQTIPAGNQIQVKKSQSTSDLPMWQCEHCTFLNNYDTKACTMCFKTSDNPKRIDPNMPTANEVHHGADNVTETCEFCTVFMEPGTQICGVCGETQTKYIIGDHMEPLQLEVENLPIRQNAANQFVMDRESNVGTQLKVDKGKDVGNQSMGGRRENVNQSVSDVTGDNVAAAAAATNVGKMIEEEQDQVYLEKKAARERFEKMNKSPGSMAATGMDDINPPEAEGVTIGGVVGATGGAVGVPKGTKQIVEPLKQENVQGWIVVDKTTDTPKEALKGNPQHSLEKSPVNRDVSKLRMNSDQSSGGSSCYNSAASSLEENVETKMKGVNQSGVAGKPTKAPQLNFVEAIEQINMKREQEQMTLDGHEIMSIIKEGERHGYEVSEVEIALKYSIEENQRPLSWLETKWSDLIATVATMATGEGSMAEQNDVGDISTQEARNALIKHEGDIEKAAKMCVQERKAKFMEINSFGQYAREDILTALYQNHGNQEESMDQLNHSVVQSYVDRLWDINHNTGGDVAIAAAARSAQLTNSVSNSVITHENFTKLVSDTTIDIERRVRMVFIEGKLRSWGRAETVVTILDKEVTLSDDPLECTLEDIIEAVRNCGDRKSSLVYLTQTCGICYTNFPMSKIRDLGACNCKLCQSCVKGYFEVAIRERYVRNWCCPLCDAPGLEDEASASNYFEFLSLILQNLVSREVLDLYEVKLRDWHLQKDPNFRWCAHCASGFIWVRPNILGMTCPSCEQKTCFMCKIKWEDQHDGLSCEEYEQWKIDNDPEKQAKGVKLYLEENGIDCPSCKMRYSLAKGGCMHFKCPQCGYEFCSGCSQVFQHQGTCKLLKSCKGKGLHCHHPRDCFYYLRDEDIPDLQKLLKDNKSRFNTEVPPTQEDPEHCPIMEQKEYGAQKKDEPCGKDAKKGMAGLCEDHYKEYLVSLINKHKIDPLSMMPLQQMKILIERNEKEMPKRNQNEAEGTYRRKVIQFIKERWQLHR